MRRSPRHRPAGSARRPSPSGCRRAQDNTASPGSQAAPPGRSVESGIASAPGMRSAAVSWRLAHVDQHDVAACRRARPAGHVRRVEFDRASWLQGSAGLPGICLALAGCERASSGRRAVDLEQRLQHLLRRPGGDGVVDRLGLPPRRAPARPCAAAPGAGRRWSHACRGTPPARRPSVRRRQAGRGSAADAVGERLEQLARLIRCGLHGVELYFHSCEDTQITIYKSSPHATCRACGGRPRWSRSMGAAA